MGFLSGSKTFLGVAYVDNQFWFWKYRAFFLFFIRQYLGPLMYFFVPFGAIFLDILGYFLGRGKVKKHFLNLLM